VALLALASVLLIISAYLYSSRPFQY